MRPKKRRSSPPSGSNGKASRSIPWWIVAVYFTYFGALGIWNYQTFRRGATMNVIRLWFLAPMLADEPMDVWIVDDTSFLKKGDRSPEVLLNLAAIRLGEKRGAEARDLYKAVLDQPNVDMATLSGNATSHEVAQRGMAGALAMID